MRDGRVDKGTGRSMASASARGRTPYLLLLATGAALWLGACGQEAGDESAVGASEISHVHGLGVDPGDDDLHVATHSGLFRSADGSATLERVGQGAQDTMGFTVVGPDRFLGSGHPGPGEDGPSSLGLIESDDGGETWSPVSLSGEADFHVLRSGPGRVYGFNGLEGSLMISEDDGREWERVAPPAPLIDLAIDPRDPDRLLGSTERGLSLSSDGGRSWRPVSDQVGLLAWPEPRTLFMIDGSGQVQRAGAPQGTWRRVGEIGGPPAALTAADARRLFAAAADGGVMRSSDGGSTWAGIGDG